MGRLVNRLAVRACLLFVLASCASVLRAEDGYALWLRYAPLTGKAQAQAARIEPAIRTSDRTNARDPMIRAAMAELSRGLAGLAGKDTADLPPPARRIVLDCGPIDGDGAFAVSSAARTITISGPGARSCLYGAFAVLRELSLDRDPARVTFRDGPMLPLRMLNHWDNPDGHVERGYGGRSIFDWWLLPERLDPRMIDYARANAALGINGVVVNNVNASTLFLTPRYLPKLRRLADAWRPYGIRLYVSANFAAPRELGGLDTADPLDPRVQAWWRAKAEEIYAAIPDFGGFLVKANSEGQPGPQDYGRTHADGANMLARAVGNRGTVIWRAFVYRAEEGSDRARQAYDEFAPLDGMFADNVILQVKNGPLDFQPREPFHPLLGAMPRTRTMLEVQPTREYLGQASGIVYLAPMWTEVLDADTGRGGTVAQSIAAGGMAGVANIGSDRNWTGGDFDQANWYAFGRLAWNPGLRAEDIAREWAALSFSRAPAFLSRITPVMMASREAVVDYTGAYGLAHQMATGHHYGPGPWVCDLPRADWNPCYYAAADRGGIGFDRTRTGSDALGQYAPQVSRQWSDPARMDERYLLWFHHVPWSYRMRRGDSVWHALVRAYDRGAATVDFANSTWRDLAPFVDTERHAAVSAALDRQADEARWWRDASIAYWQSVNGLPLPADTRVPEHDLAWYRALRFPEAPGQ